MSYPIDESNNRVNPSGYSLVNPFWTQGEGEDTAGVNLPAGPASQGQVLSLNKDISEGQNVNTEDLIWSDVEGGSELTPEQIENINKIPEIKTTADESLRLAENAQVLPDDTTSADYSIYYNQPPVADSSKTFGFGYNQETSKLFLKEVEAGAGAGGNYQEIPSNVNSVEYKLYHNTPPVLYDYFKSQYFCITTDAEDSSSEPYYILKNFIPFYTKYLGKNIKNITYPDVEQDTLGIFKITFKENTNMGKNFYSFFTLKPKANLPKNYSESEVIHISRHFSSIYDTPKPIEYPTECNYYFFIYYNANDKTVNIFCKRIKNAQINTEQSDTNEIYNITIINTGIPLVDQAAVATMALYGENTEINKTDVTSESEIIEDKTFMIFPEIKEIENVE